MARKVPASEFFETLAVEEGSVTFKCFSQMDLDDQRGFVAYDADGNQIGSAYQEDGSFVFWID